MSKVGIWICRCGCECVWFWTPKAYECANHREFVWRYLTDEASVISRFYGPWCHLLRLVLRSIFEPIHGSYPQLPEKIIANPLATVSIGSVMLITLWLNRRGYIGSDVVNPLFWKKELYWRYRWWRESLQDFWSWRLGLAKRFWLKIKFLKPTRWKVVFCEFEILRNDWISLGNCLVQWHCYIWNNNSLSYHENLFLKIFVLLSLGSFPLIQRINKKLHKAMVQGNLHTTLLLVGQMEMIIPNESLDWISPWVDFVVFYRIITPWLRGKSGIDFRKSPIPWNRISISILRVWGSGNYRKDSTGRIEVRLKTIAEYAPLFEKEGEFPDHNNLQELNRRPVFWEKKKPLHMNVTNNPEIDPAEGGTSVTQILRIVWNRLKLNVTYRSFICLHINHPNFVWSDYSRRISRNWMWAFFEVYNGQSQVNNYGDSLRPVWKSLWDRSRRQPIWPIGKPLIYGLAVDDGITITFTIK